MTTLGRVGPHTEPLGESFKGESFTCRSRLGSVHGFGDRLMSGSGNLLHSVAPLLE